MKLRNPARGMVGRIALVLVAALLLELLGNVALHRWQDRELLSSEGLHHVAATLAAADVIATAAPRAERSRAVHRLDGQGMTLNWVPRTVITDFTESLDTLIETRAGLVRIAPALAGRPLRLTILPSQQSGQRDLVGAMQLADQSFVTFRVSPYLAAPPSAMLVTLAHLALTAAVLIVALLMTRALVRPLRNLADAADASGRGTPARFAVEGPDEVRRVAAAFAAMEGRLLKLIEDHSQALVAVSHDLRTPIQRMQLRAGLLPESEMREPLIGDLIEMERFIESILSYVRDDQEEAFRLIDIAAIVTTAVDNAADAGAAVSYHGPDTLPASSRPIALKRVIANLIGNAVRHAERVEVSLGDAGGGFVITVEDDGPGIPIERRAEMLLPFRRMETARGPHSGGAGLGLAICSKAIAAMGGTIALGTSGLGGLSVTIRL